MKTVEINHKMCERQDDTIPVNRKENVCRMLTIAENGWHYHGNFYDEEDVWALN